MSSEKKHLPLSEQIQRGRYVDFPPGLPSPGRLLMAGYEECAPDYRIRRSGFPFWVLEFVAAGSGFFGNSEKRAQIRHGSVFTYGPGVPQDFGNDPDRPFRKYFLVSGDACFPAAWAEAGLPPGTVRQLRVAGPVITILDQILDEGKGRDLQTPKVIAGFETVLLALIERYSLGPRTGDSASREAYDLVIDLLQREFREIHSLKDLAKRSGYSGEYICRLFKRFHGESPYQVLLQRKMSAAWILLREGSLSIREIGSRVGYEDPLHFSRNFRRIMGCAPSRVRARQ